MDTIIGGIDHTRKLLLGAGLSNNSNWYRAAAQQMINPKKKGPRQRRLKKSKNTCKPALFANNNYLINDSFSPPHARFQIYMYNATYTLLLFHTLTIAAYLKKFKTFQLSHIG